MGKFSKLWEEINEKENQLADLMSKYEGEEIMHNGRRGFVKYINPPEDTVRIIYDDSSEGWGKFDDLIFT